jgi:hypothetical protein
VVRLLPALTLNAYGHYHETYEKSGDQWKIKTSKLTRLREDVVTPIFSLRVSDRMRNAGAKLARRSADQTILQEQGEVETQCMSTLF